MSSEPDVSFGEPVVDGGGMEWRKIDGRWCYWQVDERRWSGRFHDVYRVMLDGAVEQKAEIERLRRIIVECSEGLPYDCECDACTDLPGADHRQGCAWVLLSDEQDNIAEWGQQ